ncbi:hypothetical protein BJ912DRAFT_967327 [Pholiota molesta]|nr:hypothetical protein BJ912DRAFT_967327 [Pholiota molesta]
MILTENEARALEDSAPPPSYRSEPIAASSPNEKTPILFTSESGPAFPIPANATSPAPQDLSPNTYASGSLSNRSSSYSYYAPHTSTSRTDDPALFSSFSRVPPEDLAYGPFPPIFLVAISKTLAKGFPPAPPPSSTRPHPFTSHNVLEEDWLRFLGEIHDSANLTQKDVDRSHLPIISMIPIISPIASLSVQQYMKGQKRHKVVKVIDTWNHHFFEIRKLRVILMRGRTKLSGGPPAPSESFQVPSDSKSPSASQSPTPGPEAYWDDDVFRLLVVSI